MSGVSEELQNHKLTAVRILKLRPDVLHKQPRLSGSKAAQTSLAVLRGGFCFVSLAVSAGTRGGFLQQGFSK